MTEFKCLYENLRCLTDTWASHESWLVSLVQTLQKAHFFVLLRIFLEKKIIVLTSEPSLKNSHILTSEPISSNYMTRQLLLWMVYEKGKHVININSRNITCFSVTSPHGTGRQIVLVQATLLQMLRCTFPSILSTSSIDVWSLFKFLMGEVRFSKRQKEYSCRAGTVETNGQRTIQYQCAMPICMPIP